MKKLNIIFLVVVFSLVAGVGSAQAADINFTSDTNVNLGGNIYVITAGSVASQPLSVDVNTLTVTVPIGTFTIQSVNGFALGSTGNLAQTCSGGTNILKITGAVGPILITPNPASIVCAGAVVVPSGGGPLSGGGSTTGGTTTGDTIPPANTSISINNRAIATSSLSVNLTLSASDNIGVTQMMIGNDSSFSGATWEPYMTSKSWTLTSGDGAKTVFAKFRDATGNVSLPVLATINVSGSGTVGTVIPVSTPIIGCNGTSGFSTVSGVSCVSNSIIQPTPISGCNFGVAGFSTVSGVSCINNLVLQPMPIIGCNGTNGFSIVSGVSCVNNSITPNIPVENIFPMSYDFGVVTLKSGSTGSAVMELQRFLNRFLNLGLVVDGILGPKTIAVIKQWQSDNGLVSDGLIGAKTKALMENWAATR